MKINIRNKDKMGIVELEGKLNIETVLQLDDIVNSYIKDDSIEIIAIDCRSLEHIDSSGLGSWIQYINTAKSRNKDIYLFDVPSKILVIIEMAFLKKFFKCTTSDKLNSEFNTDFFRKQL